MRIYYSSFEKYPRPMMRFGGEGAHFREPSFFIYGLKLLINKLCHKLPDPDLFLEERVVFRVC